MSNQKQPGGLTKLKDKFNGSLRALRKKQGGPDSARKKTTDRDKKKEAEPHQGSKRTVKKKKTKKKEQDGKKKEIEPIPKKKGLGGMINAMQGFIRDAAGKKKKKKSSSNQEDGVSPSSSSNSPTTKTDREDPKSLATSCVRAENPFVLRHLERQVSQPRYKARKSRISSGDTQETVLPLGRVSVPSHPYHLGYLAATSKKSFCGRHFTAEDARPSRRPKLIRAGPTNFCFLSLETFAIFISVGEQPGGDWFQKMGRTGCISTRKCG